MTNDPFYNHARMVISPSRPQGAMLPRKEKRREERELLFGIAFADQKYL
jgi:hypothetical protein